MKKSTVYVSGLLNFETILNVENFPIEYFPIDYPFFGITSSQYFTCKAVSLVIYSCPLNPKSC